MKYCTYCGEEVFDEAVICPHCGRQIAILQQTKTKNIRTKVCKPINKRKIIKIALILFAALLLVAGVVLGFTFYKNHMYARELEGQLADKTYEYKGLNAVSDNYEACWLSFYDSGRYRNEFVDFTTSKSNEWFGDFCVKVGFDGVATIHADSSTYKITINESGDIEMLSAGDEEYYLIAREPGKNLVDWYEDVMFEDALEQNKELAIEFFANLTYWDTGDNFDNLIPTIFKDYDMTCEPLENSNTEFRITVSGRYYFNKYDFPTLTREGEFVCRVKIDGTDGTLSIEKDDGIIDAMDLYVIMSTYGSYGW